MIRGEGSRDNRIDGRTFKEVLHGVKPTNNNNQKPGDNRLSMQVVRRDRRKQDMVDISNQKRTVVVNGVVSNENTEWLQRSVIDETIK